MRLKKQVIRWAMMVFLMVTAGLAAGQKPRLNHLTTFDDKLLHFGFTLGVNTFDFGVRHYLPVHTNPDFPASNWLNYPDEIHVNDNIRADVARLIPGFTVAIVSNLRMTNSLDLRFLPGMSFGERKLRYNIPVIMSLDVPPYENYDYSIPSVFIDLPLLVKYKANRINNGRPYVVFGGAVRFDISKAAEYDLVGLERDGYYVELGAGWDHYLQFFRLSVEVKVSLGLNDQLTPGPDPAKERQYYTHALKSLRSNVFTLSFHFE